MISSFAMESGTCDVHGWTSAAVPWMKNYVKVYRAMHNLTQAQLAEKLEVSRATINAIEKEHYDPSLKLAFKMARFFEVKIEELFENEET